MAEHFTTPPLFDTGFEVPIIDTETVAAGERAAQALVADGVETGVLSPELVEFAVNLVGVGRESAILLPLYDRLNRHAILTQAHDPVTRAPVIYLASDYRFQGDDGYTHAVVEEATWKISDGGKGRYKVSGAGEFGEPVSMRSSWVAATTPEAAATILAWKQRQEAIQAQLEAESPAAKATALLEPAFGGIDITRPERTIREFNTRMLVAAVLWYSHEDFLGRLANFTDPALIDPRLVRLFNGRDAYAAAYETYLGTVREAATTIPIDESIETSCLESITTKIGSAGADFLKRVWIDLGAVVVVEQQGQEHIRTALSALNPRSL